jgi:steroid delta-isomerase-like uncharacterized protein
MTTAAELHQTLFAAIQARDFDTLRRLFHRDSIHTSGDGVQQIGAEAVVDEVKSFVTPFPDLTLTIREQFVPDESVSVIEYTFSGTHQGPLGDVAPTGKKISVIACSVLEAREGKIIREADYYDTLAMMQQLSLDI